MGTPTWLPLLHDLRRIRLNATRFALLTTLVTLSALLFILPFSGAIASPLLLSLTPTPTPKLSVDIDIKSGSDPNSINLKSKGKIPVAILSDPDFDAPGEVDRNSLTFGRSGDEDSLHLRGRNGVPNCGQEDVNGDGLQDLACHFVTQKTGFQPGDTQGILKGQTLNGTSIEGSDSIRIVPE